MFTKIQRPHTPPTSAYKNTRPRISRCCPVLLCVFLLKMHAEAHTIARGEPRGASISFVAFVAVHIFALFLLGLCNISGSRSSKCITQLQGQLRPMEPEPGTPSHNRAIAAPRTAPRDPTAWAQSTQWRPPAPPPSRTTRPGFSCTICGDTTGATAMISTAGHSIFRGRVATTISVVNLAGAACVEQQDVSHLNGFDSVSGISLRNIRLEWNLDDQTTHEGGNVRTQFVTTAGEMLQEDEHILADDSSGHATLILVQKDGAVNVEKVATSLALCWSCYRLVGGKNVPTKEIRSLANGSEADEELDLAMALSSSTIPVAGPSRCTTSSSSGRWSAE
jgi:hypothetical protein